MLELVPEVFDVFRAVVFEMKIAQKCIDFVKTLVPDKNQLNQNTLNNNQKNLSYCVRILMRLISGDKPTQQLLKTSGVFDIVYKLADPKVKIKEVGKYCEEIIEYYLSDDPYLDEECRKYAKELKKIEREEKMKRAQQAKAAALAKMGFVKKPE